MYIIGQLETGTLREVKSAGSSRGRDKAKSREI